MRRLPLLLMLCALAGCGESTAEPAANPVVVATTTHAADLALRVMCPPRQDPPCDGPQSLLSGTTDPHDYELRPEDLEGLADADLIIRSGGEIDEWLDEAIEASGTDARVVTLLDAVGGEDPHWWTDPVATQKAVEAIRDALAEAGTGGRHGANASLYLKRLAELDAAIAACVERVPQPERKIVTTHDALGRFADRYGVEVIGTVLPSRSTAGQASSAQVARLVRDVRRAGVTAVFSEMTAESDVGRAIAEEAGIRLAGPLHVDSLGDLSYTEATARNAEALVDGMSGGTVECSLPF